MNLMVSEVYDALLSAGSDETKAHLAAETLARHQEENAGQFSLLREDIAALRNDMSETKAALRTEMAELKTELRPEMAELRNEMKTLRWMIGVLIALATAGFIRLLFL